MSEDVRKRLEMNWQLSQEVMDFGVSELPERISE
jgi:hypothetical protein